MLLALGPVVFDLVSNITETEVETAAKFAKHDVIGADPVLEAMGGDGATVTLNGVIHPYNTGVSGAIAAMELAQSAQTPLPLLRGDYRPLGWWVIEKLTRKDTELSAQGVGKEINFTVTLTRVGSPGASLVSAILRLF